MSERQSMLPGLSRHNMCPAYYLRRTTIRLRQLEGDLRHLARSSPQGQNAISPKICKILAGLQRCQSMLPSVPDARTGDLPPGSPSTARVNIKAGGFLAQSCSVIHSVSQFVKPTPPKPPHNTHTKSAQNAFRRYSRFRLFPGLGQRTWPWRRNGRQGRHW